VIGVTTFDLEGGVSGLGLAVGMPLFSQHNGRTGEATGPAVDSVPKIRAESLSS
jgi:hypothetical protein